jgi:hypothetical protein
VKKLTPFTNKKKEDIINTIRKAERYFAAEYHDSKALINIIPLTDTIPEIIQISIPIKNRLTERQKMDFLAIHLPPNKQPLWFQILEPWEQTWLQDRVPKDINHEAWHQFKKIFQPSTMRGIPGLKNARINYLYKRNASGEAPVLLSTNVKCSTYVPYEMDISSHAEQTEKNMEQMINLLKNDVCSNQLQKYPTFIFFHSLLSDTIGNHVDNHLVNTQIKAANKIKENLNYSHLTIMASNDPVNAFRFLAATNSTKRWASANLILKTAQSFIASNKAPSIEQQCNHSLIVAASKELKKLKSPFFMQPQRNKQAFKAAYMEILVEAMGGVVSINCKSGKDRTGWIEIYKTAMLIYFDRYNKLPRYNDKKTERQQFVHIFVTLFHSMKTQEEAGANTLGSFGMKDNAINRVLCRDIARALGNSYTQSNKRAAWNKPKLFKKSEQQEEKKLLGKNITYFARLKQWLLPLLPWTQKKLIQELPNHSPSLLSSSTTSLTKKLSQPPSSHRQLPFPCQKNQATTTTSLEKKQSQHNNATNQPKLSSVISSSNTIMKGTYR